MDKQIKLLAKRIWGYHRLNQTIKKADCILVLGSNDIRVAERGAELLLKNYAPLIMFSGALGRLTTGWKKSEAETFADAAIKMGVPKNKILIENKSKNTGENILFAKAKFKTLGLKIKKLLVVQKPYMERRAYATIKKLWPEIIFTVTSPLLTFEKYPNKDISLNELIHIIVGDLQRIKLYPPKGFQTRQKIPKDVWQAYEKLVEKGYIDQLIDQ